MSKLKRIEDYDKVLPIVEVYTAVQSEGSRAGYPTVVIRTTGCTHRCFFREGGWCFPKNTPILMSDYSYKNIQDVKIGDKVLTFEKGLIQETNVENLLEREKETINLLLDDGGIVECTPDHKFPTFVKSHNRFKLLEAQNLKGKLIKQIPNLDIKPNIDENYKRGYIKGVARGDGSFQLPYRFKLEGIDEEMIKSFSNFVKDIFEYDNGYKHLILDNNKKGNTYNKGYYRYFISNKEIISKIQEPPTLEESYGYIAGIIDSEGNTSGNITIHQDNEEFIQKVKSYTDAEGFKSSILTQITKYKGNDKLMYTLSILGGHSEKLRFIKTFYPQIKRKRDNILKFTRGGKKVKVVDILKGKDLTQVYTLTTKQGYYIANDIFVKNCDSWYTSIHPEKGKFTFNDIIKMYEDNPHISEMMLTGGSPTMHSALVNELTHFAYENDIFITIETEGSHFLPTDYPINLLSISPKFANSIPVLGTLTPQGNITDQKMINQHNKLRINLDAISNSIMYHDDYHIKPVIDKELKVLPEVEDFLSQLSQTLYDKGFGDSPFGDEFMSIEDIEELIKSKTWCMPAGDDRPALFESYPVVMNMCRDKGYKFTGRSHIMAFSTQREV
jgi:7-carboxy-7-deazaguanine synthase